MRRLCSLRNFHYAKRVFARRAPALSDDTCAVRQCGEQSSIIRRLLRLRTRSPRSDIIQLCAFVKYL